MGCLTLWLIAAMGCLTPWLIAAMGCVTPWLIAAMGCLKPGLSPLTLAGPCPCPCPSPASPWRTPARVRGGPPTPRGSALAQGAGGAWDDRACKCTRDAAMIYLVSCRSCKLSEHYLWLFAAVALHIMVELASRRTGKLSYCAGSGFSPQAVNKLYMDLASRRNYKI